MNNHKQLLMRIFAAALCLLAFMPGANAANMPSLKGTITEEVNLTPPQPAKAGTADQTSQPLADELLPAETVVPVIEKGQRSMDGIICDTVYFNGGGKLEVQVGGLITIKCNPGDRYPTLASDTPSFDGNTLQLVTDVTAKGAGGTMERALQFRVNGRQATRLSFPTLEGIAIVNVQPRENLPSWMRRWDVELYAGRTYTVEPHQYRYGEAIYRDIHVYLAYGTEYPKMDDSPQFDHKLLALVTDQAFAIGDRIIAAQGPDPVRHLEFRVLQGGTTLLELHTTSGMFRMKMDITPVALPANSQSHRRKRSFHS
jgi:hypothetical protein